MLYKIVVWFSIDGNLKLMKYWIILLTSGFHCWFSEISMPLFLVGDVSLASFMIPFDLVFLSFMPRCLSVELFIYPTWFTVCFLYLWIHAFCHFWKFIRHYPIVSIWDSSYKCQVFILFFVFLFVLRLHLKNEWVNSNSLLKFSLFTHFVLFLYFHKFSTIVVLKSLSDYFYIWIICGSASVCFFFSWSVTFFCFLAFFFFSVWQTFYF